MTLHKSGTQKANIQKFDFSEYEKLNNEQLRMKKEGQIY